MSAEPSRLPLARRSPPPPKHLTPASAALWRAILEGFTLEAHHLAILTVALEARDRMDQARAAIETDGPYISGRFGLKAHPALLIERDSRTAFLRATRELGLDLEAPAVPRLPSRWRS